MLSTGGQCFKFLLRKPKVELAFLVILLIWELHFKSAERVMPNMGSQELAAGYGYLVDRTVRIFC